MNNKIQKSVLAGIVGTAIMTVVMMIAPMMGIPKMSPPEMVSGMLGMPLFVGWMMHFMIGIVFAILYTFFVASKISVTSLYLKGAIFGIIAFIAAQVMMKLMGTMMPMPAMEGSKILLAMGSLMGHIIFGIVVAKIVKNSYFESK
ncbi:DUF1440 domain-containing protein [Flavobacterium algicola]|uniref:DUF1440 domain-containing protein n=1 Tax=Flavobacterium algicola TaxID=556529 RepID=UPI001EFEC127|nr:DUF1440 domain-containing protein [Flavobacterium algicola]MCG9792368.1 DUF1440 domain-containing protein [Flavobacterium algicola]